MTYKIFKDNQTFTDEEKHNGLKAIVQSVVDDIIVKCSNNVGYYHHNNTDRYPGVNSMTVLLDNDAFKNEVLKEIKERANTYSVGRTQKVDNYEIVRSPALNPDEERIVANNVLKMKSQIFNICDEIKDKSINKFDEMDANQINKDLRSDKGLVDRINECVKDHDYKILPVTEKVKENLKHLTGAYPESSIKEYISNIYRKDIEDQIKCAESINGISGNSLNTYKNAVHHEFKNLINYTETNNHGQERDYGFKLNKEGLILCKQKREFAERALDSYDDHFEIFYNSIYNNVKPNIQDTSKLSMIDRLKNSAFGEKVDIGSIIEKNKELGIENKPEQNNKQKLKI